MSNIIVLKKYAYSYLSKYNTSKKNLHRILQNKIKRMNLDKKDKYSLYTSISAILTNLENNKLIDDNNFAELKIRSLSLQGKSSIFITNYLLQKGIEKNIVEKTFKNFELKNPNWETESAKIFARKKRIGVKKSKNIEKDLAKMARAGFNYKIIKEILEIH